MIELQNSAKLSEAYKNKLEDVIEYKNRYENLEKENGELTSLIFELELKVNSEERFQDLYEKAKEELFITKEALNKAEVALKSLKKEKEDNESEITRMKKSSNKLNSIIDHLNYQISKNKEKEIIDTFEDLEDGEILDDNLHYQDKIRNLEEEIEELKIENENYANNEIIRLENALSAQKSETAKNLEEKGYFEERCMLLEKQNSELKNRIDALKQSKTYRVY